MKKVFTGGTINRMKIRNPNKIELPYIIELVSKNLKYHTEEGSVQKDFPLVYQENNLENLWVLEGEGKILSHIATYPSAVKIHGNLLPTLGIGGVITEESHRGRGYSSKLMTQVLEASIQKKKQILAILWSDRWSFYERFGFYPAGTQIRVSCRKEKAQNVLKQGLSIDQKINEDHLTKSYELFNRQTFGNQRTREEHISYLKRGSAHPYFLQRDKALVAYALVDKGKDLKNYVHEWAGESEEDLNILLNALVQKRGEILELIGPKEMPWAKNFIQEDTVHKEVMGLVNLLNKDALISFAQQRFKQNASKLKELNAYIGDHTSGALIQLLFGPSENDSKSHLPLWYWGMDSI